MISTVQLKCSAHCIAQQASTGADTRNKAEASHNGNFAEECGQYTTRVKERLEGYFGGLRDPARENEHLLRSAQWRIRMWDEN